MNKTDRQPHVEGQYILIVDFGSQTTQLIARRVREAGAFSTIVPFQEAEARALACKPAGIILSGSPASVQHETAPDIGGSLFGLAVPILGICYGQQWLVSKLGGEVIRGGHGEFGNATVRLQKSCPLIEGVWDIGTDAQVWMSHSDCVTQIPKGFEVVGVSPAAPNAIIASLDRQIYGIQFHPEVVHTVDGASLLRNFVTKIAKCPLTWNMDHYAQDIIDQLRREVGSERVICGLSGGVDSTVTAALLHRAIGEQLTCVFVDHGLLRESEAHQVVHHYQTKMGLEVCKVDARHQFMSALAGVDEPEAKRKIIGHEFIEVFKSAANDIEGATYLAQGTLYPDVVESQSVLGGPSAVIKSHHNVGGLPKALGFKLIEPLKMLFKDEVRALGQALDLDKELISRHPFPGPGLAIRCSGAVTKERLEILRRADTIFVQSIRQAGLYDDIWQAFAVLLMDRSVGVMGDQRTYAYTCVLRAVSAVDGMTATAYHFEPSLLGEIANKIVNQVPGINRVLYDVTSKPPATIEWE